MCNVKAPAPIHLLRSHASSIAVVLISRDNERVYSGDASGYAVSTSTRTLRAIASWRAHEDSFLGIEEWENIMITFVNNKLHVWKRPDETSITSGIGSSAALPGLSTPVLWFSMDVNALNYCRSSLLPVSTSKVDSTCTALIALPNLIESSEADVWSIPSCERLHAAIGKHAKTSIFYGDGRAGENPTGIIMSLHLFETASSSKSTPELRILISYENGNVALRRYANPEKSMSVEGKGWEVIWETALHREAIMAMQVSSNNQFALTVSADHIIGRYDLIMALPYHRTKHPGNACIAIRDDARVCAVGGWDGKIRLYSTSSLKPLGTLKYHKDGCQALSFATMIRIDPSSRYKEQDEDADEDEDMLDEEKLQRGRWLMSGGKDKRIAIWELISFEKS
ncbi:WD40-repeat-containing domain protein [Lentinula boryana]|uniref:ASTRA-associated protein 1 n=1 Tax=Lentinula boryana TaxID=40481 RepID=A0ABQ8PY09_9AGAR|nr:WD40-repeat-containing domain protein [Lentinula boryana]